VSAEQSYIECVQCTKHAGLTKMFRFHNGSDVPVMCTSVTWLCTNRGRPSPCGCCRTVDGVESSSRLEASMWPLAIPPISGSETVEKDVYPWFGITPPRRKQTIESVVNVSSIDEFAIDVDDNDDVQLLPSSWYVVYSSFSLSSFFALLSTYGSRRTQ